MTENWGEEINKRLYTRDVVRHYGVSINIRGYCKCPFHSGGNERTASMFVYPRNRGYHCFACGDSGDSISFVQKLFGLNFRDACRKMNEDFRLGLDLDGKMTDEKRRQANQAAYLRRKEKEREENERKRILTAYYDALDRYTYYDRIVTNRRQSGFKSPEELILDDEYIVAAKNIATAKYLLDCAEMDLSAYERRKYDVG